MPDHARSADPAVQEQLDRLWTLSPGADVLGLDRITRLLARLGDPQAALPPVFHVAGTNGKGSTCAFLRAALEAAGMRVHVYSSPHLVRFNERIRLGGALIDDAPLARLLAEVLDHADGLRASFFEVTTAAAFLAFARTPADACVIEVGLGGRLDATNVIADPAACGIAQLGVDHQAFLGDDPAGIAREKAGIARSGRPLVTAAYPPDIAAAVQGCADAAGAPCLMAGRDWHWHADAGHLTLSDAHGTLATPLPALYGTHQHGNLALALAMLRHQQRLAVPDAALAAAATAARWPARMQRLGDGPLTRLLPAGTAVWLDGGHNAAAARAIAAALAQVAEGRRVALVLGMLANKDADGLVGPLLPHLSAVHAVPVPGHAHHHPDSLAAFARGHGVAGAAQADVADALSAIAADGRGEDVLILGSLYLAGEVLAANDERPD